MRTFRQQSAHYIKPGEAISAAMLAARVGMAARRPISLAAVLAGPAVRTFDMPQQLHAGDVVVDEAHVQLQSDGGWRFRGTAFDHGSVFGDAFAISATFTGMQSFVPVMAFSDHVDHQSHKRWDQVGFADQLAAHWDELAAATVEWHLVKKALVSDDDWKSLLGGVLKIAIGAAVVLLARSLGGAVTVKDDQNRDLVRWNIPGRNTDPSDP